MTKQLSLMVPDELHGQTKVYAAVHRVTITDLVLDLFRGLQGDQAAADLVVARLNEARPDARGMLVPDGASLEDCL
jgi:hypothetical protein